MVGSVTFDYIIIHEAWVNLIFIGRLAC
jgi:hypothetical protein